MVSLQQWVILIPFFLVLTYVPQPYVTIYVAMFFVMGTILNKKDEALHSAEKENLKQEIAKAQKNKENETPWHLVLGISENATLEEATKLRRLLSKIYHPDNGSAPNQHAMQRINQAYEERQNLEKQESLLN